MYVFIYLSLDLSIYLSIYLLIYLFIYLFIDQGSHRSIYLSIDASISLSIYSSIYLFIVLSIYLSIYRCIDLSIYRGCSSPIEAVPGNRDSQCLRPAHACARARAEKHLHAGWFTRVKLLYIWHYVSDSIPTKLFWGLTFSSAGGLSEEKYQSQFGNIFPVALFCPPYLSSPPLKFCVWVCSETDDNFKGNHHQSMHVASQRQLQFFCHCWAATLDWALWNGHVLKFRLKISQNHGPPNPQCFPHSEVNSWNSVMFRWSLRSKEKRWQRRVCFHVSKEGHGSS